MVGVRTREEALQLAEEAGLDLVEIQPNADPPVCKIMDFGKFRFDQQKKANEAKKKTKQVEIKERSEEHTSELQSLMRISYAVFCLKKKKKQQHTNNNQTK